MRGRFVLIKVACVILADILLVPPVTAEEVAPRKETTLWKCTVPFVCVNEHGDWCDHGEEYAIDADKDVALAYARAYCDGAVCANCQGPACADCEKVCCYEVGGNLPVPCNGLPEFCEEYGFKLIPRPPRRSGDPVFMVPEYTTTGLLYEIQGLGKDGKEFSIDTGKSAKHAAFVFNKVAKSHGGAVPGSVRTRVVPFFLHRCYLRVRSRVDGVERNDEIEGVGETPGQALDQAEQAADLLMTYLIESDPGAGPRLLAGARFVLAKNSRDEACRQSVVCQYACEAKVANIAVTRYAITRESACSIAEAAAFEFADQFGGLTGDCENTGVFPKTLAAAACATCGNGASKVADAENLDAEKTDAANAPSVLEKKSP